VSSSGKVAYFTAIFPYLVMLALLIRGLTLPGAGQGLFFFFTPQWEKLASLKVWYAAVTQSFISMSVGLGTLTTYSSYNKFRHNTNRDALIMCFADTFTSLLAGTVTFSILGHLAYELELPLKDVVKSGAMLVFVSYPEVLAKFDFLPQLFAVLFFLMFTTLGLGSAVGILSAVTAAFYDAFPGVNQKSVLKICCCVGYCVGLFYVTPGGMILLGMADHYAATVLLIFFVSAEVIAINWIYGTSRLTRDFNFMLNTKLSVYWRFCWGVLCPVLLPLLFFYALYAGAPNLPLGAQIAGWIFAAAGMLLVPAQILYTIFGDTETEADTAISKVIATFRAGNVREKIKNAFLPNNQWGPANMKEREAWQIYCEETNLYQWLPRCIRRKLRSRPSSQDGLPSTENVESY
jgi:solute carrier family 6 amino acid transporter-like protein 5/7/9/14